MVSSCDAPSADSQVGHQQPVADVCGGRRLQVGQQGMGHGALQGEEEEARGGLYHFLGLRGTQEAMAADPSGK